MHPKQDRRIDRTKIFLKDALLKLMSEKPISKISITELCTEANINRGTFYAHYDNQNSLLTYIEDEEILKFINHFENWQSKLSGNNVDFFRDAFNYTYQHKEICQGKLSGNNLDFFRDAFDYTFQRKEIWKVLLGEYGSTHFVDKLTESIRELTAPFFEPAFFNFKVALPYAAEFASSGLVGILRKGLREDFKDIIE